MKKVSLILFAAMLALPVIDPASAKARKPASEAWAADVNRSLFSGSESRLYEFSWLRPDCAAPIAKVRTVKSPSNGAIRLVKTRIPVTAHKSEIQKRCFGKPVEVIRLLYKAHVGFVGKDRFTLDVDTRVGFVKRYTFFVDVTPAPKTQPDKEMPAEQAAFVPRVDETVFDRDVFTGNEARIAAMNYVNADCSSGPIPDLRIVKAPHNGEYRLQQITYAVDRKPDDPRAGCNGKPVNALGVFYKSKSGFTGLDNIVIDVDFRSGSVRRFSYNITVR